MAKDPASGSDALRPTEAQALAAWAQRVSDYREQGERFREVEDPPDFYEAFTRRFTSDPRRSDEPVLDALLELARPGDTWLDIGAGAGRYALPLALRSASVHALDPSAAMLAALRGALEEHGIENVTLTEGSWPEAATDVPAADKVLIAHVGYATRDIGTFLDALEAAARQSCVAIVRASGYSNAAAMFWLPVHGEERVRLPALRELATLLMARGSLPDIRILDGRMPGSADRDGLMRTARRHLRLATGSKKDRQLQALIEDQATKTESGWRLDVAPSQVGVLTWRPRSAN
jgi:SAM-dependent methyltransferase